MEKNTQQEKKNVTVEISSEMHAAQEELFNCTREHLNDLTDEAASQRLKEAWDTLNNLRTIEAEGEQEQPAEQAVNE